MKKFITILLTFVLSMNNFLACYASDKFDYNVDKSTSFNDKATIIMHDNETGTNKTIPISIDFVPLFNRTLTVPVNQNVSSLIRNFCEFKTGDEYKASGLFLDLNCGNSSNFTLTLSGNNYTLSAIPEDGSDEIGIYNIPTGQFSAYIKNNDDHNLSCETFLFGYGSESTPEDGYDIDLTCYDKDKNGNKMNAWAYVGIALGTLAAGVAAGIGGYAIKNGGSINSIEMD